MPADGLNYGRMMQKALRGVMAEALGDVAENGLPSGHHFYISYETDHPGVDMPGWLREKFPEEITIVIQHEYSDLAVTPDRFMVSLSFADRVATLVVPFDAVKTFVDPFVEFGLKFDAHDADEEENGDDGPETDDSPTGGDVVRLDQFRKN